MLIDIPGIPKIFGGRFVGFVSSLLHDTQEPKSVYPNMVALINGQGLVAGFDIS